MVALTHEEYLAEVAASRERAAKRIAEAKTIFEAQLKAEKSSRGRLPDYGGRGTRLDPRPLIKAPSKPARRSTERVVGKRTVNTLARPGEVRAKCHPDFPHYAKGYCRRCYSRIKHLERKEKCGAGESEKGDKS